MDSNRSVIFLAIAILVLLVSFAGVLPALIQGVDPNASSDRLTGYDPDASIFQDDAERFPAPPPEPPVRRARILPPAEEWVPRTREERRWMSAYEKLEREQREMEADRRSFDMWREFIDSPLGGNVQSAFELLRRGHAEQASGLLRGLLPDIQDQPFDVKQPLLKASVRLFKQAGDLRSMADVLIAFLESQEEYLAEASLEGRTRQAHMELLEEVRALLAEARRKAGGVDP